MVLERILYWRNHIATKTGLADTSLQTSPIMPNAIKDMDCFHGEDVVERYNPLECIHNHNSI